MSLDSEVKIKVILLGNGSVGKTSIATRYTQGKFASTYKPSLGVDFMVKRLDYNGEKVKLLVFDTAGQEFISSLRKRYYTGASGAIIVYDVTSRKSFEDLHRWVDEMRGEVGNIRTIFVANKVDRVEDRVISEEEGRTFADNNTGVYMESSAKLDDGVSEIFNVFVEEALNS